MTFTLITPGRPAIVCGKDLIHIRVDPFEFNHQVLVAGGVNEAILNTVKSPVFIRVKDNIPVSYTHLDVYKRQLLR